MGFCEEDIEVIDLGYRVEEDIIFTPENVQRMRAKQRIYGTTQLVGPANQANIKVWNDALPANWSSALTTAMNTWTAQANCKIGFIAGTASDHHIRVVMSKGALGCADALAPTVGSGMPGALVRCDPNSSILSADQLAEVLFHELGHTLGFAHTNSTSTQITGSADQDNASCMYSNTCTLNFSAHQPTYFDRLTYALVYPDVAPLAASGAIYSYDRATGVDQQYSATWTEFGGDIYAPATSFGYRGIIAYAPATFLTDCIDLDRYYNSATQKHYFKRGDEVPPPGYAFETTIAYIWRFTGAGRVRFYRHILNAGTTNERCILSTYTNAQLTAVFGPVFSGSTLLGYVEPPPIADDTYYY